MRAVIHLATNVARVFLRVALRGHHENAATFPTALGAPNRAPNMCPRPGLGYPPTFAYRVPDCFTNVLVRLLGHFLVHHPLRSFPCHYKLTPQSREPHENENPAGLPRRLAETHQRAPRSPNLRGGSAGLRRPALVNRGPPPSLAHQEKRRGPKSPPAGFWSALVTTRRRSRRC
jgi:hypothetical protein